MQWVLTEVFEPGAWSIPAYVSAQILCDLNLLLALFNLLPGFPMDGGRVLRAGVWKWSGSYLVATTAAARVGMFFALGLMGMGAWSFFQGLGRGGGFWDIWPVLIGWFILSANRRSVANARIQDEREQRLQEYLQWLDGQQEMADGNHPAGPPDPWKAPGQTNDPAGTSSSDWKGVNHE